MLYPSQAFLDPGSKGNALQHFVLISTTVINSVIAFVEVIVMSSVQKQKVLDLSCPRNTCLRVPGPRHAGGWCGRYLPVIRLWTAFGRIMTSEQIYKYYDPDLCRLERRCYHRYRHLVSDSQCAICSKRIARIAEQIVLEGAVRWVIMLSAGGHPCGLPPMVLVFASGLTIAIDSESLTSLQVHSKSCRGVLDSRFFGPL